VYEFARQQARSMQEALSGTSFARLDKHTPISSVENPRLVDVTDAMRRFAHKGKEDLEVRGLVEEICRGLQQGDYVGEALACYYWVCQNIRYLRDISGVEFVKEPRKTIETRTGDCDDMATLLAAMLMSCGNTCRFVLVGFKAKTPPSHVFVEVLTPNGPVALDPVANRETQQMLQRAKTRIEVKV